MNKIEKMKSALELLKEADFDGEMVAKLEEELKTLTDRDADVAVFRDMLLGEESSVMCSAWEGTTEESKEFYRRKFDKFKKFFDELGTRITLKLEETPDKTLKYKDQDGDVWYWDDNESYWRYTKPSGNNYSGIGPTASKGFPVNYRNLFPMEVVR